MLYLMIWMLMMGKHLDVTMVRRRESKFDYKPMNIGTFPIFYFYNAPKYAPTILMDGDQRR